MAVSDSQTMLFAVFIVAALVGSCACLLSNFIQMNRTHKWYTLHMPLLPTSDNLRLDAALRDAEEGFNVCLACGFENLKRNIFCTICGTPIECPDDGTKKKKKPKDKLHEERQRTSATLNRRRQARALKRKEWIRKVDVEGKLFWYRDASIGTETQFPGYVLNYIGDPPAKIVEENEEPTAEPKQEQVSPSPSQPEAEPQEATPAAGATSTGTDEIVVTVESVPSSDARLNRNSASISTSPRRSSIATSAVTEPQETREERRSVVAEQDPTNGTSAEGAAAGGETRPVPNQRPLKLNTLEEMNLQLANEIVTRPMKLIESTEADPARAALVDSADTDLREDPKVLVDHSSLDFPTKIAEFVTRTSTVLVPAEQSFLKVKIRREELLLDSIETLAATPEKFSRCAIRMSFIGEQGIDAGGVYREWLVLISEQLVAEKTGIFKCVDPNDRTFYLNPMSKYDIGEDHLAHFFATGRLLGRVLLEGNVTGFHLALPLLKIIVGQPVTFSDLEYFDPDAYKSMLWMLDNDGVEQLGLDFTVTERTAKGESIVVELIPGGRNIDVDDNNKFEYVDCKLKYLLFDSVRHQLFAFLKGFYEVMPPEMLMMFDAEELDYVLSGSDEIDVDDWERNSKYTADLIEHPVREWFWDLVREMPNEYRRRLLLFSTGSSRVPLAGFMALTSYDGRLCPFTLKGVDKSDEGGYIRSHACFNRLDLPRYGNKNELKSVLYAVLSTEMYGFTTD